MYSLNLCLYCRFVQNVHFHLFKHPSLFSCNMACLVEGTFIVRVGIGGAGSVPGSVVICIGEAQRAPALLLVLKTPAEK